MTAFFTALSRWLANQQHMEGCMFGHVVSHGPLEGNKIPCSCGLTNLQHEASKLAS